VPPTVKRFTEPRRANLSKFANHHCKLHRIWKRFILVLFRFHSFLREQKIKDFRPVSTYSQSGVMLSTGVVFKLEVIPFGSRGWLSNETPASGKKPDRYRSCRAPARITDAKNEAF
jgi:hypothetical protein